MTEQIDVTMTATLRSSILNKTLESFNQNFFYKNPKRFRLIINIDPVGDKSSVKKMLSICKKYFSKHRILVTTPKVPSFPQAVLNVWNQVEANWIFHLEDDWILNKKIDVDDMISILKDYNDLACLRLYKLRTPKGRKPIFFKSKYVYNKRGFYTAIDKKRQFGLNPVLISGKFFKEAYPLMVNNKNPEKQFRYSNEKMRDVLMKWSYAIYGTPGSKPMVSDIGRTWLKNGQYRKPKKGQFLKWDKI